MKFGLLLIGGAVAVTGLVGLAVLSAVAEGAGSSLGVLVASCVPTLPPDDDDDDKDSDSSEQSSDT
ncbi:hypothetical protein IFO70_22900 [Phormidium tenue FACHB-886]|nr:hypothetical protein [Phormidium tenue FACHB-886]